MMDIAKLKAQLRQDEGEKLKPYPDTRGKLTIGVGRNLSDVGITAVESDFLLTNDIQRVMFVLNQDLPWWAGLNDNRQLVIANMCFNLGIHGLLAFKNFLTACHAQDYATAALEMEASEWAVQVGDRAHRLSKLMREG